MTDQPTTDRLAEIRARVAAASKKTTMDVHCGGSTLRATASGGDRGLFVDGFSALVATAIGDTFPLKVTVADDEGGQDATLTLHARDDLSFLLSLVGSLQERLDTAEGRLREIASLPDRIPDDENGDWGNDWDGGYNAALMEVRDIAGEIVGANQDAAEPENQPVRTECPGCGKQIQLRKDGTYWHHRELKSTWYRPSVCEYSGKPAQALGLDGGDPDGTA